MEAGSWITDRIPAPIRVNRQLCQSEQVIHCCVLCFRCSLARPHQLFFSGTVKGESAMTSLEDIGSPVDFEFVVRRSVCVLVFVGLCQEKGFVKYHNAKSLCFIILCLSGCEPR